MAKMQYDMLQEAESADREYDVRATMDALSALVRAQSQLPGRKVVLYFNPWLYDLRDSQRAVPQPDQHGEPRERQLLYG